MSWLDERPNEFIRRFGAMKESLYYFDWDRKIQNDVNELLTSIIAMGSGRLSNDFQYNMKILEHIGHEPGTTMSAIYCDVTLCNTIWIVWKDLQWQNSAQYYLNALEQQVKALRDGFDLLKPTVISATTLG